MVQIVGGMSSCRAQPVPGGFPSPILSWEKSKGRLSERAREDQPICIRALLRGQQFQLWAAFIILREASQRAPSRGPSSSAGAFAEKPEGRQDPGAFGIRFSRASRHTLQRARARAVSQSCARIATGAFWSSGWDQDSPSLPGRFELKTQQRRGRPEARRLRCPLPKPPPLPVPPRPGALLVLTRVGERRDGVQGKRWARTDGGLALTC